MTSGELIGALFILYGLILVVLGIVGSHHIKSKAAGININLWTGLGMLVFGGLMVFWALARPTVPRPEKLAGTGPGQIGPAPTPDQGPGDGSVSVARATLARAYMSRCVQERPTR